MCVNLVRFPVLLRRSLLLLHASLLLLNRSLLCQVRARKDSWAAPSIGTLPVDEVQMSVVEKGPQMASYHIPQVLQ
jgi:hypothetical protein